MLGELELTPFALLELPELVSYNTELFIAFTQEENPRHVISVHGCKHLQFGNRLVGGIRADGMTCTKA